MSKAQNSAYRTVTLESPTAITHLEYNPTALAAPPSNEWTRFVCISDTHSRTFSVPPGDVLLHSGDLTDTGTYEEFKITMDWIRSLPHPVKIIIAGNHDLPLHETWYEQEYKRWHGKKQDIAPVLVLLKGMSRLVADGPNVSEAGVVYLQDQRFEFRAKPGGRMWSVYGSPWSLEFFNWAFNYEDGDDTHIRNIPKTDILLTHGPPFDIFDTVLSGERVGCENLRARLPILRPRLHLFGHIHEAHGAEIYTWDAPAESESPPPDAGVNKDRTVFVNASNWPAGKQVRTDQFGGPGFQPVVVDLLDSIPI